MFGKFWTILETSQTVQKLIFLFCIMYKFHNSYFVLFVIFVTFCNFDFLYLYILYTFIYCIYIIVLYIHYYMYLSYSYILLYVYLYVLCVLFIRNIRTDQTRQLDKTVSRDTYTRRSGETVKDETLQRSVAPEPARAAPTSGESENWKDVSGIGFLYTEFRMLVSR